MNPIEKVRMLFGWTSSPEPEFLLFRSFAGTLPPLPAGSPGAAIVAGLLAKAPGEVTWDELRAGHMSLVPAMPVEVLQNELGSLAAEYKTVTGDLPFAHAPAPKPPATPEALRAAVLSLMTDLAKFRRAKLMFERMRSMVGLSFGFLLVGVVLAGFGYVQTHDRVTESAIRPLWQPLLFAGLIGSGFSVLSRLYALTWSPRLTSQIEDAQALKKGLVINCILSLAEGVVAATVIYLLFASGLLQGDLFPKFEESKKTFNSVFLRFLEYQPKDSAEAAKVLVWAFVAGFAERLVPDTLKRLAGKASEPH